MAIDILSSNWFFGYDMVFEVIFAVIAMILSVFAYRIYKITSDRKTKLFSIAFLFISISYFIQSFFNFLIVSNLNQSVCRMARIVSVQTLDYYGAYAHALFMIIGLAVLIYMTFNIKNIQILALSIIVSITALLLSNNIFYTFYTLSTIYLFFITWYYVKNYLQRKQKLSLLVALAFSFLLFGSFHFFLSLNHQLFYIIGHFLELIAYTLILINFYMVLKK